jgi:hypothetical protein
MDQPNRILSNGHDPVTRSWGDPTLVNESSPPTRKVKILLIHMLQ